MTLIDGCVLNPLWVHFICSRGSQNSEEQFDGWFARLLWTARTQEGPDRREAAGEVRAGLGAPTPSLGTTRPSLRDPHLDAV